MVKQKRQLATSITHFVSEIEISVIFTSLVGLDGLLEQAIKREQNNDNSNIDNTILFIKPSKIKSATTEVVAQKRKLR